MEANWGIEFPFYFRCDREVKYGMAGNRMGYCRQQNENVKNIF